MNGRWTSVWALVAVLVLAAVGAPAAQSADDDAAALTKRLADLTTTIKAHRAAKDFGQLRGDLKKAVQLHTDADGEPKLRKKVITLIGGVPKGMNNDKLRIDVLSTLGQTRDPDGGKYIKFYLRQSNAKKAKPVLLTAIRVAGEAPSKSLVAPLLKILTKSKHMGAAAKALESLGSYHGIKSVRTKILKAVVETVRKSKPGVKGVMKDPVEGDQYNHAGEETRNRWAALSGILPKTLGKLTGNENYGVSADEWFTMYDDNKRDLKALFSDDE